MFYYLQIANNKIIESFLAFDKTFCKDLIELKKGSINQLIDS